MRTRNSFAFLAKIGKYLRSKGAIVVVSPDRIKTYYLDTVHGKLAINLEINPTNGKGCNGPGSIFCKFEDYERAKDFLAHNRCGNYISYSGKWNHRYFDSWVTKEAFEDFKYKIDQITYDPFLACIGLIAGDIFNHFSFCRKDILDNFCTLVETRIKVLRKVIGE